jgi:hypothetical protein
VHQGQAPARFVDDLEQPLGGALVDDAVEEGGAPDGDQRSELIGRDVYGLDGDGDGIGCE